MNAFPELSPYLLKGTYFKASLKGEDLFSAQLRNWLTEQTLQNKFPYVWFHVANEVSNNKHIVFGAKLAAMGKLPGVADFIFLGENKSLALELKTNKNKLSDNQIVFSKWCNYNKVNYKVVYSLEEAINFIEKELIQCQ
jgi:hypothetical protein